MILWRLHPSHITLYGFDALTKAKEGWGHYGQSNWQGGHNFVMEKRAIDKFSKTHLWLGNRMKTEVTWVDKPKGIWS
jgi:hypothetical protein